jgi:hypothetical protein
VLVNSPSARAERDRRTESASASLGIRSVEGRTVFEPPP